MELSGGALNVTYTYGSKALQMLHPSSKWNAAVQDIKDGWADMAIGSFWITGQRLGLSAFTIPVGMFINGFAVLIRYFDYIFTDFALPSVHDRTVLVIPNPTAKTTIRDQVTKVVKWSIPANHDPAIIYDKDSSLTSRAACSV